MDIFRMRCFISVAECQSLSRAAREQFITQPAMSAQMNALEKELGVQLLIRGRNIKLTPAGQVALERFRAIVSEYDSAYKAVSLADNEVRGLVRMGFHGPVGWAGVPDMAYSFRDEHPDIELDMVIDTWNSLVHMLEEGTLDVAFMELSEVEQRDHIAWKPLFEEDVYLVTLPEHPLAARESVSVHDIVNEQLMLYDLKTSPHFFSNLYSSFNRAGIKTDRIIRGNHHEATIVLVLAGVRRHMHAIYVLQRNAGRVVCPL